MDFHVSELENLLQNPPNLLNNQRSTMKSNNPLANRNNSVQPAIPPVAMPRVKPNPVLKGKTVKEQEAIVSELLEDVDTVMQAAEEVMAIGENTEERLESAENQLEDGPLRNQVQVAVCCRHSLQNILN